MEGIIAFTLFSIGVIISIGAFCLFLCRRLLSNRFLILNSSLGIGLNIVNNFRQIRNTIILTTALTAIFKVFVHVKRFTILLSFLVLITKLDMELELVY